MKHFIVGFITALLIQIILVTSSAADSLSIKGGTGIVDNTITGGTKTFGLKLTEDLHSLGLKDVVSIGLLVDNLPGRTTSGYVAYQLGVEPGAEEGLYALAFTGPAFISHVDSALGGRLQFITEIGLGVRDYQNHVAVVYQHVSSAGLSSPNKGKDHVVAELGFRF